jgi:tRNA(Ile)-lysidine synthase TilS/MesJ
MDTDSAENASLRPTLTAITRKEITRAKDLNHYRIIDWGCNYMGWSRQRARQVLLRLLKGSTITIAEVGAYESAPEGPTFPNWNHNPEACCAMATVFSFRTRSQKVSGSQVAGIGSE